MENTLTDNQIIESSTKFTLVEKKAIINEALLGIKSLYEILVEYGITEKEFYLWMSRNIKK